MSKFIVKQKKTSDDTRVEEVCTRSSVKRTPADPRQEAIHRGQARNMALEIALKEGSQMDLARLATLYFKMYEFITITENA